jgi:hypothetical protein
MAVFVSIVYTEEFAVGIFSDEATAINYCLQGLTKTFGDASKAEYIRTNFIAFRHLKSPKKLSAGVFHYDNPEPGPDQFLFASWGNLSKIAIAICPTREILDIKIRVAYPNIRFARMPTPQIDLDTEFYCRYPYIYSPLYGSIAPDFFIKKGILIV